MSFFRLLRAVLKNIRHMRLLLAVSRSLDALAVLKLIICFDRLGVLELMNEPRSVDDVSEFLGGVKRRDLLMEMLLTLKEAGVLVEEDSGLRVDWRRVEKVRAMREKQISMRVFEVLLRGVENVIYSTVLNVLRGVDVDFVSPEVATVLYFQRQHPFFDVARRFALELGGGRSLEGKVILDVGCGFGAGTVTILNYLNFNCHLICADFYPNVLDECACTLVKPPGSPVKQLRELDNVEFTLLDPSMKSKWPIPDESVDVVFSFDQFQWSHKPQEMMNEFSRVLKKNGILLLTTSIRRKRKRSSIDVTTRLFGANKAYSKKEILTLLKNAGFKQGRIYLSSFVVAKK
ncbi:MAG: class I SAM-dependent methyltransferase [Candidatus Freyarchaeota archaeon]|nr:class I SAM-dependent methyltransferase [Candidatus Jordarchaeia archaeon]